MECPPQQTIRFGRVWNSSTRALRRMWNTALVMLEEECRSKRPLSMISFEMKTTSRNTANRWSFKPRIISPSTKAAAGAFLISSLMPQARRTMRRSKSLNFSKMARASSRSLPELSTASAHFRNSGYRPPWPESRSFAISCCERCSRLPFGATRASTMSDDKTAVLTRLACLRIDVYRNVVLGAHPDLDHIGVGQRDAAVRPIVGGIVIGRMLQVVGQAVDHDQTARLPAVLARPGLVFLVWVRDLDGQEEIAARVASLQAIVPLRRSKVVL